MKNLPDIIADKNTIFFGASSFKPLQKKGFTFIETRYRSPILSIEFVENSWPVVNCSSFVNANKQLASFCIQSLLLFARLANTCAAIEP
ncbi:hypothetical protein [Ferruginibacter sp.]|uniref:hypothetical protein n=1 Tax=Ferruginibacter sp. TaxID=1940288 RepID=UPI0019BD4B25|nr:hypothetical protein [Ferruginibacter sp.]MBC7627431.1 hypothetical protein [Ferruginibacter sp.]